jgi:peroxiredoxin
MPKPSQIKRIEPGVPIAARELMTISGERVVLPDSGRAVHLQFRRFAGCPVCSLHLRSFVRRHPELAAAGVREVVLFHSSVDELRRHAGDLPFAVVADPDKRLYAEFGLESSPRALLDPRAWPSIVRGVGRGLWLMLRERRPAPSLNPHGGRWGLPADFLVGRDGRVIACKYGKHADDQWSVDDLLALVRPLAGRRPSPAANPHPSLSTAADQGGR